MRVALVEISLFVGSDRYTAAEHARSPPTVTGACCRARAQLLCCYTPSFAQKHLLSFSLFFLSTNRDDPLFHRFSRIVRNAFSGAHSRYFRRSGRTSPDTLCNKELAHSQAFGSRFDMASLAPARTYYDVLEIAEEATDDDVRRAYRRLALQHHPDRAASSAQFRIRHVAEQEALGAGGGGANQHFSLINDAYSLLSDATQRAIYDGRLRELRQADRGGTQPPNNSASAHEENGGDGSVPDMLRRFVSHRQDHDASWESRFQWKGGRIQRRRDGPHHQPATSNGAAGGWSPAVTGAAAAGNATTTTTGASGGDGPRRAVGRNPYWGQGKAATPRRPVSRQVLLRSEVLRSRADAGATAPAVAASSGNGLGVVPTRRPDDASGIMRTADNDATAARLQRRRLAASHARTLKMFFGGVDTAEEAENTAKEPPPSAAPTTTNQSTTTGSAFSKPLLLQVEPAITRPSASPLLAPPPASRPWTQQQRSRPLFVPQTPPAASLRVDAAAVTPTTNHLPPAGRVLLRRPLTSSAPLPAAAASGTFSSACAAHGPSGAAVATTLFGSMSSSRPGGLIILAEATPWAERQPVVRSSHARRRPTPGQPSAAALPSPGFDL